MPSLLVPAMVLAFLFAALPAEVRAQAPESHIPDQIDLSRLRRSSDYAIREVSDATLEKIQVDEPAFTWKPGIVLLYDWNAIDQDQATVARFGDEGDAGEWRAIRFTNRGHIGHSGKLTYLVSYEYKGFAHAEATANWSFTDVYLKYDFGSAGTVTVGKSKETTIYEMVGDSANLPHQERVMSPFFQSRSVGITWARNWAGDRGTFSAGAYNDAWTQPGDVSLSDRGNQVSARVTGLAWWHEDGARFLHLGFNVRHVEDNDGTLRFRGKPASNVLPDYVDTGSFDADGANLVGLEVLWNRGPVSLLGEYAVNRVEAPASGDPVFTGWYLTGAWVLTGETRPYDRKVGYARRVLPDGRWGAVEVVGRIGAVDLADAGIDGGGFRSATLGVNWWATRRIKAGIHWTRTDLDGPGETGNTDAIQTRLQWVY